MKALLIDAAEANDARTSGAADALEAELGRAGYEVERAVVRDLEVRPCTGCFGCWTKTPGQCVIDDDARGLAEQAIAADVLAVVTPVSFGCYGSRAKGVLDRMICHVLPYFTLIDGEVHHKPRYERYPVLIALGTLAEHDAAQEALFARLVERNSVNLYNPAQAAAIVAGEESPAGAVRDLLGTAGIRTEVHA
jgi:multimeric flavodoxin WrbA